MLVRCWGMVARGQFDIRERHDFKGDGRCLVDNGAMVKWKVKWKRVYEKAIADFKKLQGKNIFAIA